MLGKRIAWIFVLTVTTAITSLIVFVQSAKFANIAKGELHKHVTPTMGLNIDFDRLKVSFFPPGVALTHVQLSPVSPKNSLGLMPDRPLKAESLGFTFRMLQAFSAGVTINKVFLDGADIFVKLKDSADKLKSSSTAELIETLFKPISLQISRQFYIKILQFEVRNSHFELDKESTDKPLQVRIDNIEQISLNPGAGMAALLINVQRALVATKDESFFVDAFRTNSELSKKGVQIQTLDVQRGEVATNVQGQIRGDLDKLSEAEANLHILLRARAEALEEFTAATSGFGGVIEGEVSTEGTLKNYKITGTLKGDGLSYSSWEFDDVLASFQATPGNLAIRELKVTKDNGSISVGELSVPTDFDRLERAVSLTFKGADFHKFAGDLRKSINNIEATLDGSIKANVLMARDAHKKLAFKNFSALVDLGLSNFALNNQTYGKQRPNKNILQVKDAKLSANLAFEGNRLSLPQIRIQLPTGQVSASGSVVGGDIDIEAQSSEVDWGADVGAVAEIPLQAKGQVGVRVHGPGDNLFLDFNVAVNDCRFVNMNFGSLEGKVTLDDRRSVLTIHDLKAKKNNSPYSAHGDIYLDGTDKIDLTANFDKNTPDDIFNIFEYQLHNLDWIPHGMQGSVSGTAKVGGDFGNAGGNLVVGATLKGERLSYWGETVHTLETNAGFDHGNYYAHNIRAQKFNSQILGDLTYSKDSVLKYRVAASKGKIRDLDYLAGRGFPVDALLVVDSQGEGKIADLVTHTKVDLLDAHLQTKALPPFHFALDTQGQRKKFVGYMGEDEIRAVVEMMPDHDRAPSTLTLAVGDSNLGFLLCAFNQNLCNDNNAALNFALSANATWPGSSWQKMSGEAELKKVAIQKFGFGLATEKPALVQVSGGNFHAGPLVLRGPGSELSLKASGNLTGNPLELELSGSSSLKLVEFLTPLIEDAQGVLRVDTRIRGPLDAATFAGGLQLENGFLRLKGVDATVENLHGAIGFSRNHATFNEMHGNFGGGTLEVGGGVDLFLNRPPVFDIELTGRDNRLKFFPVSYAEVEEAQLRFSGEHPPYLFGGLAKIRSAAMRRNFDMGGQKSLKNARYLPANASGASSFYEVKIRAVAESGLFVENDLLDAEFRGEVTLLNNFEYPQLIGRAELVKGRLLIRNNAFALDHAVVRLPSPEIFRPQFSVGGVTTINNYRISLFASGTPDDPKISFSSTPPLPQGDILSLLAFGFKSEDTKTVRQDDMSAITYSEVGSILLEQLRISKDLQSRGFRVNVVPSVNDNEANIIRPRSVADSASPKLVVQTQVAKSLEASMGATLGATQNQEFDDGLEYHLGNRTSVSTVFEQQPPADVMAPPVTSYGADLKFRWGFK